MAWTDGKRPSRMHAPSNAVGRAAIDLLRAMSSSPFHPQIYCCVSMNKQSAISQDEGDLGMSEGNLSDGRRRMPCDASCIEGEGVCDSQLPHLKAATL